MVGHAFSVFNYSNPRVYIINHYIGFSIANVIIGTILFISFTHRIRNFVYFKYKYYYFLFDFIFISTFTPLLLTAVETRFSYIPSISILFWLVMWIKSNYLGKYIDIFGGILFDLLFALAMMSVDLL